MIKATHICPAFWEEESKTGFICSQGCKVSGGVVEYKEKAKRHKQNETKQASHARSRGA